MTANRRQLDAPVSRLYKWKCEDGHGTFIDAYKNCPFSAGFLRSSVTNTNIYKFGSVAHDRPNMGTDMTGGSHRQLAIQRTLGVRPPTEPIAISAPMPGRRASCPHVTFSCLVS